MNKGFKDFFVEMHDTNELDEETTSGDIATVDTKLDMRKPKHLSKGKKCRKHKKINCQICELEEDKKYN